MNSEHDATSRSHEILVINPGATSTKIAWFSGSHAAFTQNLRHEDTDLDRFERLADQKGYRTDAVLAAVAAAGHGLSDLDAIAVRGGLLPSLPGGTYLVDEAMVAYLKRASRGEHASNLGAIVGFDLAKRVQAAPSDATTGRNVPVYVTDPVSVDEMEDVARVSGFPPLERESLFHALNIRAVARRHAASQGKALSRMNLVVCHLGTGISLAALRRGQAVDVVNPRDEGPLAMDRAGSVPVVALLDYMRREQVDPAQLKKELFGRGGMHAYLGTRDLREVEARMDRGEAQARVLFDALALQAAKAIAQMAVVLDGAAEAIILTGGMAHSERLVALIREHVSFLAPLFVYPGEDEMQALADGALRVLSGEEEAKHFPANQEAETT
ncbi:MAG: butyrate kinase [Deltaproteobacteria bacterium]|nr:butyrate kinase [Deltaproteobacteria bacterium]